VDVPEEDLVELRRRVQATRWPEEETAADQSQGVHNLRAVRFYFTRRAKWSKPRTITAQSAP
jgi:hypothetical protein